MNPSAAVPAPTPSSADTWLGHPRGLFYLFFAEMWERFCYYGMRAILVLYMVNYFKFSDRYAQGGVYAAYTSLVYCVAVLGGFLADRFLGYRRSIMFGGIVMALGMTLLVINREVMQFLGLSLSEGLEHLFFYGGMATIIVGNGFFKPNISTIVGKLYPPGDPRRDGAFTIFYVGINVGAFLGGLVCAEVGEKVSWPLGFGIAALGMLLGVFTFGSRKCQESLRGHGEPPSPETLQRNFPRIVLGTVAMIPVFYFLLQNSRVVGMLLGATAAFVIVYLLWVAFHESKEQRDRLFALIILTAFNPVFWAFFEQAGSSLTLFAQRNLDRTVLGWEMGAGTVQNLNALFIILLGPVFAALWLRLARKGKELSIPAKFAFALLQLGLAFGLLVLGARWFSTNGITPLVFIVGLYLLQTTGELCLSPVGLSMVSKLAPPRMTGMVMGVWFLAISSANFLAGQIAALTGAEGAEAGAALSPTETLPLYTKVYENSAYFIFGATALLFVLVPLLRKWMHGVK